MKKGIEVIPEEKYRLHKEDDFDVVDKVIGIKKALNPPSSSSSADSSSEAMSREEMGDD